MPLCGFNKTMLKGLDLFYTGLEKQLNRNNLPKNQAINDELEELNYFIKLLGSNKKSESLYGLAHIAREYYSERKKGLRSESIAKKKIKFFVHVDDMYYKELYPKYGLKNGLERLVKKI
jgi:hypothetical protein